MVVIESYLKSFIDKAALAQLIIKGRNSSDLFDINRAAEDFIAGLLNKFFDWNLINLNLEQKNHPAIDLGDKKNKIAVQVTSTTINNKVQHTLTTFFKYELESEYNVLYVFTLLGKSNKYHVNSQDSFHFDPSVHVIDFPYLAKVLPSMSMEKIQDIDEHMNQFLPIRSGTDDFISDEKAFLLIKNFFDRPALAISIFYRAHFHDYYQALKDMTELLKTGKFKSLRGKIASEFENKLWASKIEAVYKDLLEIRSLVEICEGRGILSWQGFNDEEDARTYGEIINSRQKSIASHINEIAREINIGQIQMGF
jgi:hypothetical protein